MKEGKQKNFSCAWGKKRGKGRGVVLSNSLNNEFLPEIEEGGGVEKTMLTYAGQEKKRRDNPFSF